MKPYTCAVCGNQLDARAWPPTIAPDGIGLVCENCEGDSVDPVVDPPPAYGVKK